ncbi:LSM domain-containing protein [Jimgerdemannia flammicorona]|uniref:LSM domain-containing protein n=1 Tax=Jimgerdemannia flammicorona TaxID=994334 RepID=A0A433BAL4_9FUNG|nr:LSM domain-containing protein [Jimgerdemannia flammicorona]
MVRSLHFPSKTPSVSRFLFYSFFKTLVGQQVTVELKNDLAITGVLISVDQFLNIKLDEIKVVDEARYPHMIPVKNCFIRGSVVRYVQLPAQAVDTALLQDAARREAQQPTTAQQGNVRVK